MTDNDKLIEHYGDKTTRTYIIDGMGYVDIKHAIPTGKRNVKFINVRETFNPYSAGSKLNALKTANDNYKKLR